MLNSHATDPRYPITDGLLAETLRTLASCGFVEGAPAPSAAPGPHLLRDVRPAITDLGRQALAGAIDRVHEADTFARLVIRMDDGSGTMVDLAQDAGPLAEPTITTVGPTYAAPELAARKILALFDRSALRDFIDVDRVSGAYPRKLLIEIAGSIDEGFDVGVLAEMLSGLDRFTDDQITAFGVEPAAMRARFHQWATTLTGRS